MTTIIPPDQAIPALASGAPLTHPLAKLATLAAGLAAAAEQGGEHGASFVDRDGAETFWTYRQLYQHALRAAGVLRANGLAPGSRVVLRLADPRGFTLALWSCIVGGYVAIPTSDDGALPTEPEALAQLGASLQALEAGALIMADDQCRQARAGRQHGALDGVALLSIETLLAAQDCDGAGPVAGAADRVAVIFPTSGSSGAPKPVMQTESAILAMCAGSAQMNQFAHTDVFLNWMPMEHVGSVVFLGVLPALVRARQVHVAHARVRPRVLDWLDLLTHYRASVAWVPNYVFNMVAKTCARGAGNRAWDLGALRFLVNAGESISPAFMREFAGQLEAHGLRADAIRPAFGMSETCSGITWSAGPALSGARYVDLGAPIPGASIRIVGAGGELLSQGQVGTLHVKGESVTRGYFRAGRDEKFLDDEWFDTGDLGFIEAGRLFLTDREGDAIVIGAVAVHGYELEAAIENLAGVLAGHAAVCCVEVAGQATLAAFYCVEPGHTAAGLHERIESLLAQAAQGAQVRACALTPERLPRTSIGKIQRKVLRRRLQAILAAPELVGQAGAA